MTPAVAGQLLVKGDVSKGHGSEGQGSPKSMGSGAVQTKPNEADIFTKSIAINSDVVSCDEKGTTELSNFVSARL